MALYKAQDLGLGKMVSCKNGWTDLNDLYAIRVSV